MAVGEGRRSRAQDREDDGWLAAFLPCCHSSALPSPASRAQEGAVQKPGHLLTQGLLLEDDKVRHSREGAALPEGPPMRLCHLLTGFGGKEGHWR